MRSLKTALAALVCGLAVLPAPGQTLVRGVVTSAETGEPLPAATVQIEGTYLGTIANAEGAYALLVPSLPARLAVRYIGYESAVRALPVGADTLQNIALKPSVIGLGEVVVSGEDPAVRLMRRVIARKAEQQERLRTFQAEAYNRFTVANDTGIVSVAESLSRVYWRREGGLREVVTARRQTANLPLQGALPAAGFVVNLYDDDIAFMGFTFVGVTHPRALEVYRFRIAGVRSLDGAAVYDLDVEPRDRLSAAFRGRIAVLDEAFALLEANLSPGEAFLFPPPFERVEAAFQQQFSDFGAEYWLPVDFRSQMQFRIGAGGLFSLPPIFIRQTARITNYAVNAPTPDSLYEKRSRAVRLDSAAVAADTLLARSAARAPLEAAEARAYATLDSLSTLEAAFAPRGLLARLARLQVRSDGEGSSAGAGSGGSTGGARLRFRPDARYNRVEGGYAEARLAAQGARASGWARVGAATHAAEAARLQYGGGVRLGLGRRWALGGAYARGAAARYASALYPEALTSAYRLLGGEDYFDYYLRREARLWASVRPGPRGPEVRVQGIAGRPRSLPVRTGWDVVGAARDGRPNPGIGIGRLWAAQARISAGGLGGLPGVSGSRGVRLEAEYGRAERSQEYARLAVVADYRIPTWQRRRFTPNTLDVRFVGGLSHGRLPATRALTIDGSLGPLQTLGGLRTRPGLPYEGTRTAGLFWEHSFRTAPWERLGWYGLARRGYTLSLHGGHAGAWTDMPYRAPLGPAAPTLGRGLHHEVGASVGGLFRLLRVDAAVRLDAPGGAFGVGVVRAF